MTEQLLKEAKKFQKKRHWNHAAACYRQYLSESERTVQAEVYADYARSLRINSETNKALDVLNEGKRLYPDHERILLEFHNLYDFLGNWEDTVGIARQLIKLNPQTADYHFRLGRSYSFLKKHQLAKKSYQTALEFKHGCSFQNLVKKIQQGFVKDAARIKTTYIFIDGKNNYGAFIHEYGDRKFFTKISNYTNAQIGAGREESFYQKVRVRSPQLHSLTPAYIDSQIIDNVSYLTIELVKSTAVTSDSAVWVIDAAQKIASAVPYQELVTQYPPPKYVFQFKKGRAISVVHFFSRIHEEPYNEKLFAALELIMKQNRYPGAVRHLMKRLQSAIMDNQLYQKIKPEKHYSLLHGDFAFQNLLFDEESQCVKVIDWSSYTVGPHFIDLARYFTSLLTPYSEIERLYTAKQKLSTIEHIFFLYALTLFYFQKMGPKSRASKISDYILPAIEDLEFLVLQKKLNQEGDEMTDISKQLAERDLQIQQLEQRNMILNKEKEYLRMELSTLQSSKSWKITRPLRLFTESRTKK
ncbi:phosphotransferase [Halobacillus andaensis]|uniref:phosphotransferase n=1 Tax=Halobacillus andaensis TaxID=1176239 RepID=UPI003D7661CC